MTGEGGSSEDVGGEVCVTDSASLVGSVASFLSVAIDSGGLGVLLVYSESDGDIGVAVGVPSDWFLL